MSTKTRPKIEKTSDGLLVVRLFEVPVNHDQWDEAIRLGCPETDSSSDIWKVADKYPTDNKGTEIVPCISLVGFGRSWNSPEGVKLTKKKNLPVIGPRHTFAIGAEYPTLNFDLDKNYFGVVSLETCEFGGHVRAPLLWFFSAQRLAYLGHFHCGWGGHYFVGLLGEVVVS